MGCKPSSCETTLEALSNCQYWLALNHVKGFTCTQQRPLHSGFDKTPRRSTLASAPSHLNKIYSEKMAQFQIYSRETIRACSSILDVVTRHIFGQLAVPENHALKSKEVTLLAFAEELLKKPIQQGDFRFSYLPYTNSPHYHPIVSCFPLTVATESPSGRKLNDLVSSAKYWAINISREPSYAERFGINGIQHYLTPLPGFDDDEAKMDAEGRLTEETLPIRKQKWTLQGLNMDQIHPVEHDLDQQATRNSFDNLMILARQKAAYLEQIKKDKAKVEDPNKHTLRLVRRGTFFPHGYNDNASSSSDIDPTHHYSQAQHC